jgi:hypothetical protein
MRFVNQNVCRTTHAANAKSREYRGLDHVVHPYHSFFSHLFPTRCPRTVTIGFLNAGVVGVVEVTVA